MKFDCDDKMAKLPLLFNLLFVCLPLEHLIVTADVNVKVTDRKHYKIKLRILSEKKEIFFKVYDFDKIIYSRTPNMKQNNNTKMYI